MGNDPVPVHHGASRDGTPNGIYFCRAMLCKARYIEKNRYFPPIFRYILIMIHDRPLQCITNRNSLAPDRSASVLITFSDLERLTRDAHFARRYVRTLVPFDLELRVVTQVG